MYNVFVSTEAQNDYTEISDYYDSLKPSGGFSFAIELQNTIEVLEINPYLYAKRIKAFRRAFIKNFPYLLYYQILESKKEVEILAILHNKRSKAFILKRLK